MIRALFALAVWLLAAPNASAREQECRDVKFRDADFTVCVVDMTQADMRLFLLDLQGHPYGHFAKIDAALAEQGKRLIMAMNAGMYHDNRDPVGLFVEEGAELTPLVSRAGPGNFGMLPNGVFCIRQGRADVIETLRFRKDNPRCTYASQSGPMLVIDGKLHPRFLRDSTSRYKRNGVGTSADGRSAVFVISKQRVNFHHFASLFKDALKLPNALYFDGNISRLHAPDLGRSDNGFRMGPVVGVVVDLVK